MLPAKYALQHRIVPLKDDETSVEVAMRNSSNREVIDELQFVFNKRIKPVIWEEGQILAEIYKQYGITDEKILIDDHRFEYIEKQGEVPENIPQSPVDDQSVIKIVNDFITEAIRKKASDIHVESYEDVFRIRFRLDGELIESHKPPIPRKHSIISRLKIMAGMDIAEKRRPQDGRIRMQNGNTSIDIRVSTLPTEFGEKVVLRILDKSSLQLSLEALGFEMEVLDNFKKILRLPYGMVLVTGPTGSGKTTTLYSALNFLNHPNVNIISIEDPIEYNLSGINQTQVKPEINLTFANILRTILRQDPNIIMVGEIRDSETAEIAVRAALTGHLVLSTLHTNDAVSTIIRLIDMGIEPFLLANSLKMIIAQRLVRKICSGCKSEEEINWAQLKGYNLKEEIKNKRFLKGQGCEKCNFTGYSGRMALIESILIDDDFSQLIMSKANLRELRELARKKGLINLMQAGMNKAIAGITTLDEVIYETMIV